MELVVDEGVEGMTSLCEAPSESLLSLLSAPSETVDGVGGLASERESIVGVSPGGVEAAVRSSAWVGSGAGGVACVDDDRGCAGSSMGREV